MTLISIWAQGHQRAIGKDGDVPWHVPEDLALFKRVTSGHPVIMGRATWDSLPERFRPLPGRTNIVVTRNKSFKAPGATVVHSLDEARELTKNTTAFVMGGAQIYDAAQELIDGIVVTDIDVDIDNADAFAPGLPNWPIIQTEPDRGWLTSTTGIQYRFTALARPGTTPFDDDPLRLASTMTTSDSL